MRPLHDFLFEILKGIPQDGTFDQLAPLNRLAAKNLPFYASFDLSAATDRLPIAIQRILVSSMFGEKLASLWVNILTQREYELLIKHTHRSPNVIFRGGVGRRRKSAAWEVKKLRYAVGQPMGALSS